MLNLTEEEGKVLQFMHNLAEVVAVHYCLKDDDSSIHDLHELLDLNFEDITTHLTECREELKNVDTSKPIED